MVPHRSGRDRREGTAHAGLSLTTRCERRSDAASHLQWQRPGDGGAPAGASGSGGCHRPPAPAELLKRGSRARDPTPTFDGGLACS